ncbi:Hypothetical protein NTJ_05187 [Nesidiocoris tenuis]|uniref:Uncharacterized protein n=1 Tax=Nesidiocoris tenuis TaxID=355587 RepID=A0ABN7AK92_9HEMI|nr:Hypothetical protein NTJ_05187 [Nesidiocoris tenuis]
MGDDNPGSSSRNRECGSIAMVLALGSPPSLSSATLSSPFLLLDSVMLRLSFKANGPAPDIWELGVRPLFPIQRTGGFAAWRKRNEINCNHSRELS